MITGLCSLLLSAPGVWGAPEITCDEPQHDFGSLFEQADVSHTFVLRNTGDQALKIDKIQSTCGCSRDSLERRVIEPGGTSRLSLVVNLTGRQGKQDIVALVHSNDPRNPRFAVSMKGSIRRGVEVRPALLTMRAIMGDPVYEQEVDIAAGDGKPFQITGVETGSVPFASVKWVQVGPGVRFRLTIGWTPEYLEKVGLNRGRIVIRTDHPSYPEVGVDVSLQIIDEFICTPGELEIRRTVEGGASDPSYFLLVKSLRKRPIAGVEVTSPLEGVEVEVKANRPDEYAVRIGRLPFRSSLAGKVFRLRVLLKEGGEKWVEVPIRVGR